MEKSSLQMYIEHLNPLQQKAYFELEGMLKSIDPEICAILFVKQPYFYVSKYSSIKPHHRPSVMLSFFNDHVNIFALAIRNYQMELSSYKVTPKHTLQLTLTQEFPHAVLLKIFRESLHPQKEKFLWNLDLEHPA